mmetsp:Transcript_60884/g.188525  ORF Transcript_60884/g.188525 Transcript_60884/m.188525 type:complete len:327 (-) Transcript_60884:69-1049(-)
MDQPFGSSWGALGAAAGGCNCDGACACSGSRTAAGGCDCDGACCACSGVLAASAGRCFLAARSLQNSVASGRCVQGDPSATQSPSLKTRAASAGLRSTTPSGRASTCSSSWGTSGRSSGNRGSPCGTSHQTSRCCALCSKARPSTTCPQNPEPEALGWQSAASRAEGHPCRGSLTHSSARRSMSKSRALRAVSRVTAISGKVMRSETFQRSSTELWPEALKTAAKLEEPDSAPKSFSATSARALTTKRESPSCSEAQKVARFASSSDNAASRTCASRDTKSLITSGGVSSRRYVGTPSWCSMATFACRSFSFSPPGKTCHRGFSSS